MLGGIFTEVNRCSFWNMRNYTIFWGKKFFIFPRSRFVPDLVFDLNMTMLASCRKLVVFDSYTDIRKLV